MTTYGVYGTPHVGRLAGETLTASLLNVHLRDNLNAAFPTGSLHYVMQAETSVETTINGFLLEANGVDVSRTTYASLNTVLSGLSYPFGNGDGSTTMGLPDCRARALMNAGSNAAMDIGDNDGVAESSRQAKHTILRCCCELVPWPRRFTKSMNERSYRHSEKIILSAVSRQSRLGFLRS